MRLSNRGLVDRLAPVSFSFDGRQVNGFAGDTIASALLGEGTRMIARSFKYHRPRGVLTAGSDDPSGLVTLGRAETQTPNIRAALQEIHPGLEVFSQNAWPSLNYDVLALNDWLSPFLGAGFYYKTFMWPARFWEKLYEPVIRRAAGLGALSGFPASEAHEKVYAFCDLLVIGSGPAGLVAALQAGRAGARVILADEEARFGGRLNGEAEMLDELPAQDWLAATLAELEALPNVRLMPRTTVTGCHDGGVYSALERVNRHRHPPEGAPVDAFWRITARQCILASGARERIIAFPGNDRPGVMTASAVRTYLHRYGVVAGPRVAVFGNNDDAHRTAADLAAAGVQVTALIDSRADASPPPPAARQNYPVLTGAEVFETEGRHGLHTIRVRHGGVVDAIEADCLAVSGGWNPDIALATHLGAKPVWDDGLAAHVPGEDLPPGMRIAGSAAGERATAAVLRSGLAAAQGALADLGRRARPMALPLAGDVATGITAFWQVKARGKAFLDLQNDVTAKDIALAAREGMSLPEHMKRYTTQGMATDQGKVSNVTALGVLADVTGAGLGALPPTGARPPYAPVPIAAMGAGGLGDGFAPIRHLPSHQAALERGAVMVESGLWYRAAWFPQKGESGWRESCDREVRMVRNTVGVCDVSSLGKIELQGPDAAAFLDLVYTGRMSSLAEGRCRYGLMLREDGMVLDDGTCARLWPQRWVLTTTTGAAAEVMSHLEFVHQVHMPGARLHLASVTEHWAQFALTGPRAAELLDLVLDHPLPLADLPYMGCLEDRAGGVGVRLFRISFSGELGYEIAIPSRWGASLWRILLAQAEALEGGAYGLEALNVLRIEKGYITHSEIDGRVTAEDLGLGRMVADKPHIGRAMSQRPGLAEDRLHLVGLRGAPGAIGFTGGALLFDLAEAGPADAAQAAWTPPGQGNGLPPLPPIGTPAQGHVTSACLSPTLGQPLALALLRNGHARHGQRIRVVDHLRRLDTWAEIAPPAVHDPEGARLK